MAGLIQKNMGEENAQGMVGGAQVPHPLTKGAPPMPGGMQQAAGQQQGMGADVDTGPDPETNEPYQQAITFAMQALYGNNAAKDVAKSLKSAPNIVDALSNTAYEVTSIIDEKTQGQVPDELLVLLASTVLEEVSDIANAAGLDVQPSEIALAMKQMILRYLGEQGVDTTQLEQAMSKVNPEDFNRMAQEQGGLAENQGVM